jgi:hypothetical protein
MVGRLRLRQTRTVASTGTLAVAAGSAAAVVTFVVVSIVGSASPRPDLGGPVFVERPAGTSASTPTDETDTEPAPGPATDPG